ncbi:MAG: DUF4380 domain-containing protein [Clostridiales bacterium]|jgi:hypothetical protein|nr:DUF4380 domain-containing protein [Clostridiales bacterium]
MVQSEYEEISHERWGKCVRLSNGAVDLLATLDFGPRIIRFGAVGGENEFFEDTGDVLNQNGNNAFDVYGGGKYWHIYGGHRLWAGPEAMPRSYYPDHAPVQHTRIENGIRLTPPPQAWTGLQMELDVVMGENNSVTVTHKITNIGAWEVEFAPWALTVLKHGGLEVVPQPKKDTGLLGNRVLALWPYTKMSDSRVVWGDDFITVRPDSSAEGAFKFGINNERGFAAYFNHGNLFFKRFSPIDGGMYPDGGVSFETYTTDVMLEMETLGELQKVQPRETAVHTEVWELILNVPQPETDGEINAAIKKYIEK